MHQVARLLLLCVTCLGLLGLPVRATCDGCPEATAAADIAGDEPSSGCVTGAPDGHDDDGCVDACASTCGCCHSVVADALAVPRCSFVTPEERYAAAGQRAPPPGEPIDLLQVPRGA